MQVAITCRHGSIPDDVRESITRKSEKLLTYFERVTAIGVTVIFENERMKGRIRVEILLDAEHKHNFVATDEGDDVPSTFDRALSKMEQQLRKYKAKIQDHRRDVRLNELVDEEDPSGGIRSDSGLASGRRGLRENGLFRAALTISSRDDRPTTEHLRVPASGPPFHVDCGSSMPARALSPDGLDRDRPFGSCPDFPLCTP